MDTTKEWLASLRPGDKVFHMGKFGDHSVLVVKRLTKTQIVCGIGDREIKFRLSDGFNVGGDAWSMHHIVPITDELIAGLRLKILGRKAVSIRSKVMIPETENELISFIADMEKWVPVENKGGNA